MFGLGLLEIVVILAVIGVLVYLYLRNKKDAIEMGKEIKKTWNKVDINKKV